MNRSRAWLLLPLIVAGCMPAPKIAAPRPAAPPPPPAPLAPVAADWKDAPVNAGGWSYARDATGSIARFGVAGAVPDFEMRCDPAARLVYLSRAGALPGTMTVTTSYGTRSWPAVVHDGRVAVPLAARDPSLDQLAFSRARFAIDGPAPSRLILPAWAEPTRVIEDCRA